MVTRTHLSVTFYWIAYLVRLSQRCIWGIHYSAIEPRITGWIVTDISRLSVGLIFRGRNLGGMNMEISTLEEETTTLSRNAGYQSSTAVALRPSRKGLDVRLLIMLDHHRWNSHNASRSSSVCLIAISGGAPSLNSYIAPLAVHASCFRRVCVHAERQLKHSRVCACVRTHIALASWNWLSWNLIL